MNWFKKNLLQPKIFKFLYVHKKYKIWTMIGRQVILLWLLILKFYHSYLSSYLDYNSLVHKYLLLFCLYIKKFLQKTILTQRLGLEKNNKLLIEKFTVTKCTERVRILPILYGPEDRLLSRGLHQGLLLLLFTTSEHTRISSFPLWSFSTGPHHKNPT